jgi:hypothetical protein
MPQRVRRAIDGDNVLYHYLQKDLLVTDIWLFQMLLARLIVSLGIWMSPRVYQRMPLLVPFAVRDPSCRGNPEKGLPDQWGAPNADGVFRDDNSLVKNIPKSLVIVSEKNGYYANGTIAKGFVASHVWRQLQSATLASRERWTYSFVPNLVWLPTQVSKLSDREGSFVQTYLQAVSVKIYRDTPVAAPIRPIVESAWQRLPLPVGIPQQGLPDVANLNFFEPETSWFDRRIKTVRSVVEGLELVTSGQAQAQKIFSSRYTAGLPSVAPAKVQILLQLLAEYLAAVEAVE